MTAPSACLIVSILIGPFVNLAAPQTPAPPAKTAETAAATKTVMQNTAQKQRDATLAAMQASIDKQRASVAKGVAASVGKQAGPVPSTATGSFFNLPPLPPPPQPVAIEPAVSQAALPDIVCDPMPESDVAPILLDAAQREALEPRLLTAIIQQESAFRPCAISQKGAQGLMQLMPETSARLGVKDPFDPKQNIDAGAKYLKELLGHYNGNLSLTLGAYNAGPSKVDEIGAVPTIPETTTYVKEILERLATPPGMGTGSAVPSRVDAPSTR